MTDTCLDVHYFEHSYKNLGQHISLLNTNTKVVHYYPKRIIILSGQKEEKNEILFML